MAKLHEVLAVDSDVQASAKKIVAEATNTFLKKTERFAGHHKTLEMFDEARQLEADALEETQTVSETVAGKVNYVAKEFKRLCDTLQQKETTNQVANAKVDIEGFKSPEVPATLLLALIREFTGLRNMYSAIPTLKPGRSWELDEDYGDHIFKDALPTQNNRTEKQSRFAVAYEATEHHPAQIQTQTTDVSIGKWNTNVWSGLISPAIKAKTLGRIDSVILELKKAKTRANQVDVVKSPSIGEVLLAYINGPINGE